MGNEPNISYIWELCLIFIEMGTVHNILQSVFSCERLPQETAGMCVNHQ